MQAGLKQFLLTRSRGCKRQPNFWVWTQHERLPTDYCMLASISFSDAEMIERRADSSQAPGLKLNR